MEDRPQTEVNLKRLGTEHLGKQLYLETREGGGKDLKKAGSTVWTVNETN